MGDHAWTKVTCRPGDRAAFEEMGFDDDSEPPDLPGAVTLVNDQANYACDSEFRDLAAKGIPFIAKHASGDEYGDGRYACDGRRLVHADCLHGGGFPAVEVDEAGQPDPDQLHLAHDYYDVSAAAKKAITAEVPPGCRWKSADDILRAMDPALFREQRRWFLAAVQAIRDGTLADAGGLDWESAGDLLDGLDSLLDDLADYAHDVLGMDCLLEEQPEER
ncbi:MAG: hypothetical protein JXB32_14820 [Deltaproteobacteria bacterium]|nr:hypothetical protein [Deltaproteobacteria bacterium]